MSRFETMARSEDTLAVFSSEKLWLVDIHSTTTVAALICVELVQALNHYCTLSC